MKPIDMRPLRIINAGIPGYTLFLGYYYLEHRAIADVIAKKLRLLWPDSQT
jgi:hypothetical protein